MSVDQKIRDLLDDQLTTIAEDNPFDAATDANIGARLGRRRVHRRRAVAGVAGLALTAGGAGLLVSGTDGTSPSQEVALPVPVTVAPSDAEQAQIAEAEEQALTDERLALMMQREERSEALGLDPRSFFDAYGGEASGGGGAIIRRSAPNLLLDQSGNQAWAAGRSKDVQPNATRLQIDPSYLMVVPSDSGSIVLPNADSSTGPFQDNTFTDYGTNGEVDPADEPQSTFALDVDTGSYNVADLYISEWGQLPPADSVRLEEFVNYFDYGYPQPEAALGVYVDGARNDARENAHIVRVGVNTKRVAFDERQPAAITFVVDVSGSMDIRERLGLVQSSLALLVLELDEDDTVAIVTYSNNGEILLQPTRVGDGEAIVEAINQLGPNGSTNLEAGLRIGYGLATDAFREDANNLVVLASDGVANVGNVGPDSLAEMIKEEANDGINLVTIGYGMGNFNDTLMEQLANNGDGFYAYLDDYEEAEHFFQDQLSQLLVPTARDAKAQVTFDPEFIKSYRLLGYENRSLQAEDFRDDTVDAGELGSGHAATALYLVELTEFAIKNDVVVGTASVRWEDPQTGNVSETSTPIMSSAITIAYKDASTSFQLAKTVANFAEILGNSPGSEVRASSLEALAQESFRLGAELETDLVRQFAFLVQEASQISQQ